MSRLIALVVVCVMPLTVAAAELRVQTLDFEWRRGEVAAVSQSLLTLRGSDGEQIIPWSEVLQIDAVSPAISTVTSSNAENQVAVYPVRGGRVSGILAPSDSGIIALTIHGGATVQAPLTAVAALRFHSQDNDAEHDAEFDQRRADRKPGRDLLLLLRGDDVRPVPGTLVGLNQSGWTFAFGGSDRTGTFATALGVILGSPAPPASTPTATFRLANGDEWHGNIVGGDDASLQIDAPAFGVIPLPWSHLLKAELSSARLVHLETLQPTFSRSTTILGVEWPMQINRNVINGPLTVGRKTYERGIGVHANHTLRFQLKGEFMRFAVDVGVDASAAPHGSCIFRIKADDKVVAETDILRSEQSAERLSVDVSGIKTLTLEVDAADELDLSDRANWCNPVLIRAAR